MDDSYGLPSRPNLFIVGARKCGTTSLYHYLKSHPRVFMSAVKEPHYFSSDLGFQLHLYRTLDEYLSLFQKAKPHHACVGEASTSYFDSKIAAGRIEAMNPKSRIVIMLRDPVDYLYAFHNELLFRGRIGEADFGKALDKPQAAVGGRIDYRQMVREWPENIRRFLKLFGRMRVHVIVFEDFIKDPGGCYGSCLEFLGLVPDARKVFPIFNESRVSRSAPLSRFLSGRLASGVGRFVFQKIPFGNRLDPFFFLGRPRARPHLAEGLRESLGREFRPVVSELEILLERKLPFLKGAPDIARKLP